MTTLTQTDQTVPVLPDTIKTLTNKGPIAPTQPDISYLPDPEKYTRRTQHRLKSEKLHLIGLPDGFPQRLISTFVWEGKDLAREYDSVYALSEQETVEIESALAHFKCSFHHEDPFQTHPS